MTLSELILVFAIFFIFVVGYPSLLMFMVWFTQPPVQRSTWRKQGLDDPAASGHPVHSHTG